MTQQRKRIWIKVNGETNTLRQHLVKAGYRLGYESTLARKCKCKPSDIPIGAIERHLGAQAEIVERPDNWQEIMYGSPRGAQKNRAGNSARTRQRRKQEKRKRSRAELVGAFLGMQLSASPQAIDGYY